MDLQSRLTALIEPPLLAMGYLLVRVRFGGGHRPVLQIMAEKPDGTMTVEDCADVSRAISALLDVEDPIDGHYALEISSPGIDRPLMKLDDYRRFAGYEARVETVLPIDGRKRWRGRILDADAGADTVRLLTEDKGEVTLPFDRIAEARLVLTDDLIAASLKGTLQPPAATDVARIEAAASGAVAPSETEQPDTAAQRADS